MATLKEQMTNYSKRTIVAQSMIFKEGDIHWFYFTIDPTSAPISRNFFKGESKGAKMLAGNNMILVQDVPQAQIELELKRLCQCVNIQALDEATQQFVKSK